MIEFSIGIPREQLRPKYGDGLRGIPLDNSQSNQHLSTNNRGEKKDAATTRKIGGKNNV